MVERIFSKLLNVVSELLEDGNCTIGVTDLSLDILLRHIENGHKTRSINECFPLHNQKRLNQWMVTSPPLPPNVYGNHPVRLIITQRGRRQNAFEEPNKTRKAK